MSDFKFDVLEEQIRTYGEELKSVNKKGEIYIMADGTHVSIWRGKKNQTNTIIFTK